MIDLTKKIYTYILIGIVATTLSSCGGTNPHMDKKSIEANLSKGIAETFEFDKIKNIEYEEASLNADESEKLQSRFESQVPYEVYICTAELENLDLMVSASYRLVCAYNDEEWQIISCTENNKETWDYKAKSTPDKRRMYKDISTLSFQDFEQGYIGSELHSNIEIKSESYDENVHRQNYEIELTINTDFGHYDVPGTLIYYFINGEWIFGDFECDDQTKWEFIYNDACELNSISDKKMCDYATVKDNFLTYSTNPEYVSDYGIKKIYSSATKTTMSEVYEFKAKYNDFCNLFYKMKATYEWKTYEWSEPDISIEISKTDFSPLINKSFKCKNNTLTVTDCHVINEEELKEYNTDDYDINESSSIISCEIKEGNNTSNITAVITVPLRDDNWESRIISNGDTDIESLSVVFNKGSKCIKINNQLYKETEEE